MTKVVPQLNETYVEGQHHHYYCDDTYDEEKVVETLLSPSHALEFCCYTFTKSLVSVDNI